MTYLDHWLRTLSSVVSLLALVLLLFVVAGNVFGRLILDLTGGSINIMITGAIELAAYSLLILVFGSIVSAIPDGLVQVDIIESFFPKSLALSLEVFWLIIMATGAGIIAFLFAETAITSSTRGAVTQDLQIPLSLFYWATAIQCTAVALVTLISAVSLFRSGEAKTSNGGSI